MLGEWRRYFNRHSSMFIRNFLGLSKEIVNVESSKYEWFVSVNRFRRRHGITLTPSISR